MLSFARGLQELHSKGIVHNDLKMDNIAGFLTNKDEDYYKFIFNDLINQKQETNFMENSTRLQRKNILIRGLQMLLFGFFINLGLTVISFLAFVQFFWLLINREKNLFIAGLASGLRNWFGQAIQFMLASSDYKPFPWSKI